MRQTTKNTWREPEKIEAKAPESVQETKPAEEKVYYTKEYWKKDIYVYRCAVCGHCENKKDNIILHVLTHVPECDKNKVLDILAKE